MKRGKTDEMNTYLLDIVREITIHELDRVAAQGTRLPVSMQHAGHTTFQLLIRYTQKFPVLIPKTQHSSRLRRLILAMRPSA
jgi:hypothetical protein